MRKHLTYANVMATIAVFLTLGGTAVAARVIIKRSSQLRNGVVTNTKVKRSTLAADRLSTAARASLRGQTGATGQTGQTGATGQNGAPGTAKAFGFIFQNNGTNTVDETKSQGLTDANVTRPAAGTYCFTGLGFTPKNVQVTSDLTGSSAATRALVGLEDNSVCPGSTEQIVVMWDIDNAPLIGSFTDNAFYILIN